MFSFGKPHRGDSCEYIQYTIFQYNFNKRKLLLVISCSYLIFSQGLLSGFGTVVLSGQGVRAAGVLLFFITLMLYVRFWEVNDRNAV